MACHTFCSPRCVLLNTSPIEGYLSEKGHNLKINHTAQQNLYLYIDANRTQWNKTITTSKAFQFVYSFSEMKAKNIRTSLF
jgi:hypothetical protein